MVYLKANIGIDGYFSYVYGQSIIKKTHSSSGNFIVTAALSFSFDVIVPCIQAR